MSSQSQLTKKKILLLCCRYLEWVSENEAPDIIILSGQHLLPFRQQYPVGRQPL